MASPYSPYSAITWLQAQQALSLRLNDTAQVHWTAAEVQLYLGEALRVWNVLTQAWIQDWAANYQQTIVPSLPVWQSTGNSLNSLVGANPTSPRTQTLTDNFVYTVAQYHLLEPPNGNATWAGTPQFSLADFTQALQRRRDVILQATACNVGPFSNAFSLPPATNRVQLPDSSTQSILDLLRIRFLPAGPTGLPASTLWRDDSLAMEYFANGYEQNISMPLVWDVIGSPPQAITFDANPNVPNTLDILAMLSGGIITPPTASPLLMPDDWYWVLKFGMMADLLSKESESTDLERAAYCEQRFQEGIKLMNAMPWIMQARVNNVPCDTPSVAEADEFDYEWQSNPNAQSGIVQGGIDLFAISPLLPSSATTSINLSLVANAPIPAANGDFIQVSRDVLDTILDEAQHLALFKHGGSEAAESITLHKNFIAAAVETNRRLRESGIFASTLRSATSREDMADPRFALQEVE